MNLFLIIVHYILLAFCFFYEVYIACIYRKRRKAGDWEIRTKNIPATIMAIALALFGAFTGSYRFFMNHEEGVVAYMFGATVVLLMFVCHDSRSIATVGDKVVVTKYFFYIKKYPKEEVRFNEGAYYYKNKCLFIIDGRYDDWR